MNYFAKKLVYISCITTYLAAGQLETESNLGPLVKFSRKNEQAYLNGIAFGMAVR